MDFYFILTVNSAIDNKKHIVKTDKRCLHNEVHIDNEWFYSLKVSAHFRSKRTGGFSPDTIHRFNALLAPLYNTYDENNI